MVKLVSVIIPVYNGQAYLQSAIDSVLGQSHPSIEVIAVDDGSKDDSASILAAYADRIRVVTQSNAGCAAARSTALALAQGEFVAFLDQDDVWEPHKLERQVALLEAYPEAVATYCDYHGLDESGNRSERPMGARAPAYSGQVLELLVRSNCIVSASVVLARRAAIEAVGGIDKTQPHWADDWDLWMRLAARGAIIYQPEDLAGYRRHSSNTSSEHSFEMSAGNLHALRNIASLVKSAPPGVQATYREALFTALVAMGWQQRRLGRRWEAVSNYLSAWNLKPLRAELLLRSAIIATLPSSLLRQR